MKRSKRSQDQPLKPQKGKWKAIAIALYLTFLILSTIAYTANRTVETNIKESYEYHLVYRTDGRQSHYYVERINSDFPGKIDLTYTTKSNSLSVTVDNIDVLHIYCRSMYEDECKKVYGFDPSENSNYYKWYFIEKNHLNVNVDSEDAIKELKFIDTPFAYKVIVDGEKWIEGIDYFYTFGEGIALSDVPAGITNIDLYFKPESEGVPPNAQLSSSKSIVNVDESIMFDGSSSYDADGTIISHIFDFGDGTFRSGDRHTYSYTDTGVYGIILMVRDNDYLVDYAYLNLTVVQTSDIPEIQDVVPNQEKPEDSPPWTLDLSTYNPIAKSDGIDFYWYLTGENTSLYSIMGENGSDDRFIFTPVPDAFGNDEVTLWLKSSENLSVSQKLWINITPVNDPPVIYGLPDLILHYDDPYVFNYEPYVDDKETPRSELILTIYDGYNEYISIDGLSATFNYPQSLVGETTYATVMISDGEDTSQDIISIQVSSDNVPKLINKLPDIWIYEGTTKYNVFDLDDYFMDPDQDAIFFSYGQTHLDIYINMDHTVDISASSEWTGSEFVTFRARDPIGALAEDTIIISVLPVNDPPRIQGVPNFVIRYGTDYRFDLTPYIFDNDNSTDDLTIIVSDPEHIRHGIENNLVIILNYPSEYLGRSENVRLSVSDGLDLTYQEITVTISEDFPPELLNPLPDIVFMEDEPQLDAFDLDNYFLDADGDVLFYTTGNKFINITIKPDHTVDFSAPKDWFGHELVYIRATDPTAALQEDLMLVTVLPVNDAPILFDLPPQYGNESERWILDLNNYIIDVDNNISELIFEVDSDYVVVSGTTLVFLGSKQIPNSVELMVSDGEYMVTKTIEIHLKLEKGPKTLTIWDLFINLLPFLIILIIIIIIASALVYRKRTRYVAEEVFLIHRGGTLINHLMRNTKANIDDVIFSGMFTAVQEFIKDSFKTNESENGFTGEDDTWLLDELKLGQNKILIERSENTYLAVIFSGDGSNRLRRIVTKLLDKIETKYENTLPNWDGDIRALKGTKEILSVLIKSKSNDDSNVKYNFKEESPLISKSELPTTRSQSQVISANPQQQASNVNTTSITQILGMAKTFERQKVIPRSKELLRYTSQQSGVGQPGLPAWPMNIGGGRAKMDIKNNNLPTALNLTQYNTKPKTVIMESEIAQKSKPTSTSASTSTSKSTSKPIPLAKPVTPKTQLQSREPNKPVTLKNADGSKEFEIDPAKSLLRQLAELEEMDFEFE